jgi:cold shock CspA family protein
MSNVIKNMSGQVKVYFEDKGFGFIRTDELGDVFFHIKNCVEGYQVVNKGDNVSFDAVASRKKSDSYEALRVAPM